MFPHTDHIEAVLYLDRPQMTQMTPTEDRA
jgi:hypothetical protein